MCAVVHCMRRLCMWQVQGLPGHDDAALEVGALPCPPPAVLGFRRTTRTWGGVAAGASAAAALWQWNPRVRPSKMPSFYFLSRRSAPQARFAARHGEENAPPPPPPMVPILCPTALAP